MDSAAYSLALSTMVHTSMNQARSHRQKYPEPLTLGGGSRLLRIYRPCEGDFEIPTWEIVIIVFSALLGGPLPPIWGSKRKDQLPASRPIASITEPLRLENTGPLEADQGLGFRV